MYASKYSDISTEKLIALRDSRLEDLLQGAWSPEALYAFISAAGLGLSKLNEEPSSTVSLSHMLEADSAHTVSML